MKIEAIITRLKAMVKCTENWISGNADICSEDKCENCNLNYEKGNMGEQRDTFIAALKILEETRWIPVEEQLPKKQDEYLVTWTTSITDKTFVAICEYNSNWVFPDYINRIYLPKGINIIAWKPIEPYIP